MSPFLWLFLMDLTSWARRPDASFPELRGPNEATSTGVALGTASGGVPGPRRSFSYRPGDDPDSCPECLVREDSNGGIGKSESCSAWHAIQVTDTVRVEEGRPRHGGKGQDPPATYR